ncbi:related to PDR16 - involved in lipid biosynthesis and multidrug resistance [Melanopsichium pennsylvanicum]|uniref:Related to PDR16 - involved in lipid biosynthesis and multidrug resistance n=2 Tax=Melanopsichium pennsylvanicum TaxID=63383 RepID=A0AAJ5C6E1_9BASI
MSFENNNLSKTPSRASTTRSSLFSRASGFMTGSRHSQAASESQATASSSSYHTSEQVSTSKNAGSNMGSNTDTELPESAGPRKFDHIFTAPDPSVKLSPPAPLSDTQQAKYDEMLEYFKSTVQYPTSLKSNSPKKPLDDWEKMRNLSRESMIRYLRATKWDVTAAKKRLTDTIAWRREYGVDSLKAEDLEHEAKTGKETILGYDNRGRPLHYMHPSRNTTEETPTQMQFAVWVLERAIDLMPPGVEMLALLINFGGKKRNPTSISNAKLMLYILQNHYVERLGIALCINVPWIFKAFWNAIYPFIDPVTKGKCKFDEAIKDEVPNGQLASDFGGLLDFAYDHDKYWPELVEMTNKRREEQLERFRTQCNVEIGASEWVIRGGDELKRSTKPHKQDSGFHEVEAVALVKGVKDDDIAEEPSTFERQASIQTASTVTAANNPAPSSLNKPAPSYLPLDEDESQLDRFYTSQTELPPQLEGLLTLNDAADWENQTVVNHVSQSAHAAITTSKEQHKQEHGHYNKEHDTNAFVGVVAGISAGAVGGKADSDVSGTSSHKAIAAIATGVEKSKKGDEKSKKGVHDDKQKHKNKKDDRHHHHHHHHFGDHIKAVFHRKSQSESRPTPTATSAT